jgi:hypothetical protein
MDDAAHAVVTSAFFFIMLIHTKYVIKDSIWHVLGSSEFAYDLVGITCFPILHIFS